MKRIYEITTDEQWSDKNGSGHTILRLRITEPLRLALSGSVSGFLLGEFSEISSTTKGIKWSPWVEGAIELDNVRRFLFVEAEEDDQESADPEPATSKRKRGG